MNKGDVIAGLIVGTVLAVSAVFMVVNFRVQAICLAKGWPSHKVNVFLTGYCIKRVDQTDVVVPVSELKP